MRSFAITVFLGGVVALGGCDGDTRGAVATLEARVAGLERRLPHRTTASPRVDESTERRDVVDRLDADLRSLEERLASVEADVALLREAALAGDVGPRGEAAVRREQRSERRERMRDLTSVYRDKLAEVRRQYRDDPTDPERQRALRDVVDWYRSERRAIMRDG